MAPQATLVVPTPTASPALSTHAATKASRKPFVPVLLLIFLGVCLAYTLSYVLYRIVKSRRRVLQGGTPDTPDRGVSRFMNGARLTLGFGHHKSTTPTPSESPDIPDKEKPPTDPPHSAIPTPSPAGSSSTPLLALMPSFTIHPNQEIGQVPIQVHGSTDTRASILAAPTPTPAHQPFSQRIATKVKFLSSDRAEAIALDPKLAPVQGPLCPLSMARNTSRKKRTTLFGLGLKPLRAHSGDVNLGRR